MKATKLVSPGVLETAEMDAPALKLGEVAVDIAACGFTDRDMKAFLGQETSVSGYLGGQMAGAVAAVAEDVTDYQPGDRLAISRYVPCGVCELCKAGKADLCRNRKEFGRDLPGGLAGRITLDAHTLANGCIAKLPSNLKFEEVCGADVAAAVLKAQRLCATAPGQKLLVLGCGPAGCMHTHIAKLRGVDVIIQGDPVASRMEMSRPFMADVLLDLSCDSLSDAVNEATHGRGVDVAIVAADDPSALADAAEQTAVGGTVLLFSRFGQEGRQAALNLTAIQEKQLRVLTSDGYGKEDLLEVLWLASKRKINLKWMITSVVDAADLDKKLEAARAGKELRVAAHP